MFQDHLHKIPYTLTQVCPGGGTLSTDATLSALVVNDGTTDHTIDLATTPYTLNVGNAVTTVTLTATTTHTGASVSAVTLGGSTIDDTVFTDGITVPSLAEGDNVIVVTVTAENGSTETYMVTVTREAATSICLAPNLGGRTEIWSGEVTVERGWSGVPFGDPHYYGFHDANDVGALSDDEYDHGSTMGVQIFEITFFVGTSGTSRTLIFDVTGVTPTADDPALRLHVCGDAFNLGDAVSNQNRHEWLDSGLDWSDGDKVLLALSASSDATLSELELDGTPVAGFAPDKLDYALTVPFGTTQITVEPTVNERGALVAFLDADDATIGHQVDLEAGANVVKVQVTPGDRGTTTTYTLTVTREAATNTDLPWSTTMTVGTASTGVGRGYDSAGGGGSLEDDDFTASGVAYDVGEVIFQSSIGADFNTSPALANKDDYILEVAGVELPLAETTLSVGHIQRWNASWLASNATALDATNFETTLMLTGEVLVCFRTTTQTCPGGGTTNTAATGKPAITGTPQVGQTLTAGLGTIADAEDLPSTVFPLGYSFQWVRVAGGTETNVGTNSRTYPPLAADEGSTIRVDVSFTDGAGNVETVPSDVKGPVVRAAEDCAADRPGYDWCTTMTVEVVAGFLSTAGFRKNSGQGALTNDTINYGSKSFAVGFLQTQAGVDNHVIIGITDAVEFLPLGTVFNFGGTEFTADGNSEQSDDVGQYQWDLPANFGWIDGQKVTVSANLSPAPESATVDGTTLVLTHVEDLNTGSTPAADSYTVKLDGGAGPTVSGVSVDARTVTLTLATAVTAADTNVTVDYDAPASSPLQDASGLDAPDSEDFPVTNNTGATTNVCTAPDLSGRTQIWTGTVTVEALTLFDNIFQYGFGSNSGVGSLSDTAFDVGINSYTIDHATVGTGVLGIPAERLMFSLSDSGLTDADRAALTLHVCGDAFAFSAATYTSAEGDLTDSGHDYDWDDTGLDWSSETTRTLYLSVLDVTIEAEHDSIGAGLEDLNFTLTRTGDTTDALVATVTITQEQSWLGDSDLSHTVTFLAGDANKDLTIAASKFSFTPSTTGDLTATVSGGSDTVQIISTSEPPITVGFDKSEYTFEEDDTDPAAVYAVATLDAAYPRAPSRVFDLDAEFSVSTESGTAKFRADFAPVSTVVVFNADDFQLVDGQYVARKPISDFAILDDVIYEGSEQFLLKLEKTANTHQELFRFQKPDGTAGEIYDVTITDEEDLPVLSLSVDPPSIAEEDDDGTTGVTENVSTVTVAITNVKTFAVDRTVTLTFSGDATEGTHYSVSPMDADTNAAGHQVLLPADDGDDLNDSDSSVAVTVTAAGNDTADGNVTLTVTGDFDGTDIGSRDITIVDDDTTTTNTVATGAPGIMGTPQEGHELTATLGSIADTDVLPATFPDDYTFQWVRLDSTNNPTNVGTNSSTYTVLPADVDSTIRVDVSFTDGAGNLEGPLMSAALGPVVALLPVLSFAETTVNVDETAGTVELTVNLAPASTGQVTVDYATSDATAEAGEDYTAQSDTLNFIPGETSKTITIQITDDDIHEAGVEFFVVDLANPSGATESATAGKTEVHITSEDSVPVASMDDVTVDEGAGTMRLTLGLSHPSTKQIIYSTSSADVGGTATVSDDYTDFLEIHHDTFFVVAAGERTKDFDIDIIDDGAAESDETITIKWTKAAGDAATPNVLNFTGTITDNDPFLWFTTMTVGETSGDGRGYLPSGSQAGGSLDDNEFTVPGDKTYQVRALFVDTNSYLGASLQLSTDLTNKDDYILEVAGVKLPLDSTSSPSSSYQTV